MADVLLIRHGQASFGATDYDCLSTIGEEQSRHLGHWFRQSGQSPDLIATGSMRRHIHTADLCAEAAGVAAPRITLAGFDEMDHVEMLTRYRPDLVEPGAIVAELARAEDPHRAFQSLYAAAAARWISGGFDDEYACSWGRFRANVLAGLDALAMHAAGTIWAFTSGGPIAVIANALLGAPIDHAFTLAWPLVNTSISRISTGAKRSQLIGYNAWPHLEVVGESQLITYR